MAAMTSPARTPETKKPHNEGGFLTALSGALLT